MRSAAPDRPFFDSRLPPTIMQALFSPLRIGRFLRRLRPAFAAALTAAPGSASAAGFVCAVRSLRGGRSPGPWSKAQPIDIAHGTWHPPRIRAPLPTLAL